MNVLEEALSNDPSTPSDERIANPIDGPKLSLRSFPLCSIWSKPIERRGCCCNYEHIKFFDVNKMFDNTGGIRVCFNAKSIYRGKIPRHITPEWKNRISLEQEMSVQSFNDILFRGFGWYRSLWSTPRNPHFLIRKILQVVSDCTDPNVTLGTLLRLRTCRRGIQRFKNILCNVDGVLVPLFLSFFGKEVVKIRDPSMSKKEIVYYPNTWEFFDSVLKCLLIGFVSDVFKQPEAETYYKRIKQIRQYVKGNVPKSGRAFSVEEISREFWFYKVACEGFDKFVSAPSDIFRLGLITQTRSSGLPPPQMRIEAYRKFFAIASKIPEQLTVLQKTELVLASRILMGELFQDETEAFRLFSRSVKNCKISLSTSADISVPQNEGGKIEACRRMIQERLPVKIINLHNGEPTGEYITQDDLLSSKYTPGEAMFYISLNDWFTDERPRMLCVRAVSVAGPGKYRIATVSDIRHATFLQPLAQILKKWVEAIDSSKAGMSAGNHMWEFFRRISSKHVHKVVEQGKTFHNLWLYSEDWEAATDSFSREATSIVLSEIMRILSIPEWYRKASINLLTSKRIVFLPELGCDIPTRFVSESGVLMGDPMTKIILQVSHSISRIITFKRLQFITKNSKFQEGLISHHAPGFKPTRWELRKSHSKQDLGSDGEVKPELKYKRITYTPEPLQKGGRVILHSNHSAEYKRQHYREVLGMDESPEPGPPSANMFASMRNMLRSTFITRKTKE